MADGSLTALTVTIIMKSTKVQTLGAVYTFRHANGRHGSVNSACKMSLEPTVDRETLKCGTLSNIMRMRIFRSDKMATTGISHTMVEAL